MADLKTFLTKLSQDSSLSEKYQSDPSGTMKAAGLSAEDQKAVMSGDRAAIASRLGPSPNAFGITVNITVTLGIS